MLITKGMENTDFYSEYMSKRLLSKEDVLNSVDKRITKYKEAAKEDHKTSAAFYTLLDSMLNTFKERINDAVLFDQLPDWWTYNYHLEYDRFILLMEHVKSIEYYDDNNSFRCAIYDASYPLVQLHFKTLSAGEYAKLYDVGDGTVRQWIRRGKLRTATKIGNEWKIPVLTAPPGRGYEGAQYLWDDELEGLPEEYAFLNDYIQATFFPDRNDKNKFHVILLSRKSLNGNDTSNNLELILDSQEREKLELIMIARPEIRYSLSY